MSWKPTRSKFNHHCHCLKREVIKRVVIEEEDDEIETRSKIFGIFSTVEDVGFGEKRIAKLRSGAYGTMLKENKDRVAFSMMADTMRVTFPTTGNN